MGLTTKETSDDGRVTLRNVLVEIADAQLNFYNPIRIQVELAFRGFPMGAATLRRTQEGIVADFTADEGLNVDELYPRVTYRAHQVQYEHRDTKGTILSGTIQSLVLSTRPNTDPRIKTIGEQIVKPATMTAKDIRDIAAYWGVSCSYRLLWDWGWKLFDDQQVADFLWEVYGKETPFVYGEDADSLKLHLRPLSSLTDEEQMVLYRLINGLEYDWKSVPWESINHWYMGAFPPSGPIEWQLGNYGPAISYLQSIGVFAPGSIDEKYVQLID